jgi:hypothetical protein
MIETQDCDKQSEARQSTHANACNCIFLTGNIGHGSAYFLKKQWSRCLICHPAVIFAMDSVQKPCLCEVWWQQLPASITEPLTCSNEWIQPHSETASALWMFDFAGRDFRVEG